MLNGVMTGRIAIAPATVKPDGTFDVAGAMSGSYQVRWDHRRVQRGGCDP